MLRMNKIKNITYVILLIVFGSTYAQQDAQYTQYMYNTLAVNPAYAGTRDVFSALLLHRSQWVGLEGAPKTQSFNLHSPVSKRLGIGLSVVNDEIGSGIIKETNFDIAVSYAIDVSYNSKLSFGIKGGGHILNIDFTELIGYYDELGDLPNVDNKFSPNVGAGLYFYSDKFYFGLSAPNLLETTHFDKSEKDGSKSSYIATERINYYIMMGYVFDINERLKLKPSFLVKAVSGAPIQTDVSLNLLYNEKFTLGAAYRLEAAVSALAGFQISDKLMLGLAYDRETTELGDATFNNGSFEVFLRFELFSRVRQLITPRFF